MSFFPQGGGLFGQGSFQIDPNSTPEMLARKREMIASMMPRYGQAKYVGQGVGQLATGIAAGMKNRALDEFEGERSNEAAGLFNNVFSGGQGGGNSGGSGPLSILGVRPDAPAPNPNDAMYPTGQEGPAPMGNVDEASGLNMGQAVVPDLSTGIAQTAEALGMNPEDLATIISYETAGTFDPAKRGPTTQWGQHRGLIQFGEPQAQEYGVDWNDPLGSQLGPDGAIVRYFQKNGWKPGMGIEDAYSIVNAGAPGRYNASDANNGGAPGTVMDKVQNQMGAHRRKAQELLGGSFQPGQGQRVAQNGAQMNDLMMMAQNPWLTPQQRQVVNGQIQTLQAQEQAQMQRQFRREDAQYSQQLSQQDPMYQLNLQKAQLELQRAQNPAPGFRVLTPEEAAQMNLPDGAYQVGADGKVSKIGGGGVTVNNMPAGQPNIGTIPQGYSVVKDETQPSGYRMVAISGGPEDTTANDTAAQENRERSGAVVTQDIEKALGIVQDSPGWTTGVGAMLKSVPGTQAKSLDGLLQTIKANVGFDRLQQMRDASKTGGALGAINKTEMDLLQSVLGNLDQSLDDADLARNLRRVNEIYLDIIHGPGNRPEVPQGAARDFGALDLGGMTEIDVMTLNDAEMDAFEARMQELGY